MQQFKLGDGGTDTLISNRCCAGMYVNAPKQHAVISYIFETLMWKYYT
jgi:hypothetical protein